MHPNRKKGRLISTAEGANRLLAAASAPKEAANRLLTTPEAAGRVSLAAKTLEKLRVVGGGPRFKKLSGAVRYTDKDLQEWVESCTRSSTSDDQARAGSAR